MCTHTPTDTHSCRHHCGKGPDEVSGRGGQGPRDEPIVKDKGGRRRFVCVWETDRQDQGCGKLTVAIFQFVKIE